MIETHGAELHALLGPTNTGKTHAAVQRMLEHHTGMIGLPLRLLAREVFDRVTARLGSAEVALVTGEERRVPARPRYWVCTVEAMPPGLEVDFLAVDEIQLSAHAERGHVFTDRLLAWRGRIETWFLGAATIRPLVQKLVPLAHHEQRPRLSQLRHAGHLGLGELPPRTAVVAFSASSVYQLAERLRARRGGAAVVLGALSPRARSAQVQMYQSGEVDFLVATDAIGMGLNMDVDCVAFAECKKFDGRRSRTLDDAELAQIAGRAGRNQRDGRFATLDPAPPLSPTSVIAIEENRFPALRELYWRNSQLDFDALDGLLSSLRKRPFDASLKLMGDAADFQALCQLAAQAEVRKRAQSPTHVELLWQVCQIPDYRQLALDDHSKLLQTIFVQLHDRPGGLDTGWVDGHLRRLDNPRGDIETLMARIASVRTWTYISHRSRWLKDASAFQERALAIEDRLSDALHESLIGRFVDGRKKSRAARTRGELKSSTVRSFSDLRALIAPSSASDAQEAQVDAWLVAPDGALALRASGHILLADEDEPLGRLRAGADRLRPEVIVSRDLPSGARQRLQRRLHDWLRAEIATLVAPIATLRTATAELEPAAHGILYQLDRALGTITARDCRAQLDELSPEARHILQEGGVVFGRRLLFLPALLEAGALRVRQALNAPWLPLGVSLPALSARPASLPLPAALPRETWLAMGYVPVGDRLVRADVAERVWTDKERRRPLVVMARRMRCSVAEVRTALQQDATPHGAAKPRVPPG